MSDAKSPAPATLTPVRPRGRPRNEDPGNRVSAWLPIATHDRLIRLAKHRETTVSSLVRELLIIKLR